MEIEQIAAPEERRRVIRTPPAHLGAAALLGITPRAYLARRAQGLKWCTDCQEWHPRADFGRDRSQRDQLNRRCKVACRARATARRERRIAAKEGT